MKRLCTTLLLLCMVAVMAMAGERSAQRVVINGTKYYLHAVAAGETLYSLSKTYGVSEQVILDHNHAVSEGLKAGAMLKIPVVEDAASEKPLPEKKLAKTFNSHYATKGETLYGIARLYEISMQQLLEDNPDIDPTHLALGQRILIRKKQIGKSNDRQTESELNQINARLNSVAGESEQFYVVQKGDTFYSLLRRHGISEQELSALNNGLQAADLKLGAIIKLPRQGEAPQSAAATESEQPTAETSAPQAAVIDFRAHCCEPLRVSMLLPMSRNGAPNANYIDFYKGFLMGLDSVRMQKGHSVDLMLFDTQRDAAALSAILADEVAFGRSQLIIGPVYEEELAKVIPFAEQHQIPVVSPLAQLNQVQSDVVFQMAPNPLCKYDKAHALLDGKRVTLIYGEQNDAEFEQEMLALLGEREFHQQQYKYVHPSVKLEEDEINPSDLTPILDNEEENLYIILSDNEIEVDRILAALASADTNLRARSLRTPKYSVLGNSRWNRYANIDRTIFFKTRVTFFSTYHAKRDSELIKSFDRAYIEAFGSLPSLYAYRGYDAAMIFVPAMYGDIEYDLEDRRFEPLKTLYRFKQAHPTANHINRDWMRVTYNSDFTITLE